MTHSVKLRHDIVPGLKTTGADTPRSAETIRHSAAHRHQLWPGHVQRIDTNLPLAGPSIQRVSDPAPRGNVRSPI